MKIGLTLLILALSLLLSISSETRAATNVRIQCYYVPIYSGTVILSKTYRAECGYGSLNAYTVGTPNPYGESVCIDSPMPYGWVITGRFTNYSCGEYSYSALSSYIKQPGYQEDVCGFSPVPSNYEVIAQVTVSGCGAGWLYSKRIRRKF